MTIRFADIAAARPTRETLSADHAAIEALLDRADRPAAIAD